MLRIMHKLEVQLKKLEQVSQRLKSRDEEFFQKCVETQLAKDHLRAMIYANECAEIRKMAQIVLSSQLAIEQATIRFQTIGELDDVMIAVAPIASIIQETKGKLVDVIPSVATKLDEVNVMLGDAMKEVGGISAKNFKVQSPNKEAMKVLEEANRVSEQKIRERFPELPQEIEREASGVMEEPIALAVGGTGGLEKMLPIDRRVFEYIKHARDGNVSIVQCASDLGVTPRDVERVILRLEKEGKVSIQ